MYRLLWNAGGVQLSAIALHILASMERRKWSAENGEKIKRRTKCQLSSKSFPTGKSESSFHHSLYPISLVTITLIYPI